MLLLQNRIYKLLKVQYSDISTINKGYSRVKKNFMKEYLLTQIDNHYNFKYKSTIMMVDFKNINNEILSK